MKYLCACLALVALCACTSPKESGIKVIVGAHLDPAGDREAMDYSVIVISGSSFKAIGTQAAVPVPKGSEITRGLGMSVHPDPAGDPIEVGRPANLVLEGNGQRREMRNGEWVQ